MKKENLLKFLLGSAMIATMALTVNSCSKDEDPCEDVSCLNGGSCDDGNCNCPTGYEGSVCETVERAKFIGTYSAVSACLGTTAYTVSIAESSSGIDKVVISNMGNSAWTAIGTVNGTSISISGTATDATCGTITMSGGGSISGNIITLSNVTYTVSNTTTCNNLGPCTETFTKQ